MIFPNIDQTIQLLAWFLAFGELIFGIYFLITNPRHRINRFTGVTLFILAINSFINGFLPLAPNANTALILTIGSAITNPILSPVLMHSFIALIKPTWLKIKGGWLNKLLFVLAGLPILFTISDILLGTNLWYTGLPETYINGWIAFDNYAQGSLSIIIRWVNFYAITFISLFAALYIALRSENIRTKRLGWLYFGIQLTFTTTSAILHSIEPLKTTPTIITNLIMTIGLIWITIQKLRIEKVPTSGRIRIRAISLVLGTSFSVFAVVTATMTNQTTMALSTITANQLRKSSQALSLNTFSWLENSRKALEKIVTNPAIISMDPEQQKVILETAVSVHPDWYLVSTTDTQGINVARSDNAEPKDYSDRDWVNDALAGNYITYQTLVERTNEEPAIVFSMPIKNEAGEIIGVGMFASDLKELTKQVNSTVIGETGYAFVVNANNQVIAHPNNSFVSELHDLSQYPPVIALRELKRGDSKQVNFVDDEGVKWHAYINVLPNSWGIIVQETEEETLTANHKIAGIGAMSLSLGFLLVGLVISIVITQTLYPILRLTVTATAIAKGNLEQNAEILSTDEVGQLARTFNTMTERLRETIGSLETQVAERTAELEQRSEQLHAATEVSSAASAILDTEQLIQNVTELIRERFNLSYVGLFLVDETFDWAILRAGTGEVGKAMLARGHKIRVGEGMVGWSVSNAQARVAQIAAEDAFRLTAEELPETRSEAAIPIQARGKTLGALTVQSAQPEAFDEISISTLQTMANQIGVAISNARLYTESQEALATAHRAYGEVSRQAWQELVQRDLSAHGYRSTAKGSTPEKDTLPPETLQTLQKGKSVTMESENRYTLLLPILVRDTVIGVINTHKPIHEDAWTAEEINLLETLAEQLGVALEGARLYQETQRRAIHEQLTGEIATRLRETLDIETVLATAAKELRDALGVATAEVWIESENE